MEEANQRSMRPGKGRPEGPQPWDRPGPSRTVVIKCTDEAGISVVDGQFQRSEFALVSEDEFKRFQEILSRFGARAPAALLRRDKGILDSERARQNSLRRPDLTQYFQVNVDDPDAQQAMVRELTELWYVDAAYVAPLPAPPPDFFTGGGQSYLRTLNAPLVFGVGDEATWGVGGGLGDGVTVAIIDYNWNLDHHDLLSGAIVQVTAPLDSADTMECIDHGTAVLGILAARHDSGRMRGMVPQASFRMYAADTHPTDAINVSDAINRARGDLGPGDVILIEQQTRHPNHPKRLIPVEFNQAEYDAIIDAVEAGIVVVEAAGNADENLDDPLYASWLARPESGAILVGAGDPDPVVGDPLSRLPESNFGSRVHVQGWGSDVDTLGYGDLPGVAAPQGEDPANHIYTQRFGKTSAAAAIVAGVVASLQGIARARGRPPLDSRQMRDLLIRTGTPQAGNLAEHIGPQPNVAAAMLEI